ncbi:hypothetical protein [Saccharothrix deserti]|uniref:hypothetical protein n=1 Tax=Saccharothrix deserti TaxID=2593674 RepID=UPI00131E8E36|nr:hypothetical protein [Saccharothrix deserti]
MHRLTTMTATAAALVAAFHATAPTDRDWRPQGDFSTAEACQAAGVAGALFGQWDDWMCDHDHVLWVDK